MIKTRVNFAEMDMSVNALSDWVSITATYTTDLPCVSCDFMTAFEMITDELKKRLLKGEYDDYTSGVGRKKENAIIRYANGFPFEIGYTTSKHNATCLLKDANNPYYLFRATFVFSVKNSPYKSEIERCGGFYQIIADEMNALLEVKE